MNIYMVLGSIVYQYSCLYIVKIFNFKSRQLWETVYQVREESIDFLIAVAQDLPKSINCFTVTPWLVHFCVKLSTADHPCYAL